ncbi:MAG: hypothetical protein MK100_03475 [Phycisphaerales bacterium]|nr:hypothetical protein [Phycisphaerales bacterium]
MDEQTFQQQFSSLLDRITDLPERSRALLVGMVEETELQQSDAARCLEGLENSIDSLRLCVKYLVFDLEATRRENDCLRRLLSEADDASGEYDDAQDDRESFWEDGAD